MKEFYGKQMLFRIYLDNGDFGLRSSFRVVSQVVTQHRNDGHCRTDSTAACRTGAYLISQQRVCFELATIPFSASFALAVNRALRERPMRPSMTKWNICVRMNLA